MILKLLVSSVVSIITLIEADDNDSNHREVTVYYGDVWSPVARAVVKGAGGCGVVLLFMS